MLMDVEIIKSDLNWINQRDINKVLIKKVVKRMLFNFNAFQYLNMVEISILLTNDTAIQRLNHQYRGIDKATNVLSFPYQEIDQKSLNNFQRDLHELKLGDIAFCYQKIYDECIKRNKTFKQHFMHLLVHSVLHLIGFTHDTEVDAGIMEELEIKILRKFSVPNPYLSS